MIAGDRVESITNQQNFGGLSKKLFREHFLCSAISHLVHLRSKEEWLAVDEPGRGVSLKSVVAHEEAHK